MGGLIIGTLHLIDDFIFFGLLGKTPIVQIVQYMASGALGMAAFAGGLATALLGTIIHFGVSFLIAAVFILSATQLPLLGRNAILGGLLFGVATYFVMNFLVLPFSTAPKLPIALFTIIEGIVANAITVGMPLGIIVRRITRDNQ